jgi:hypothetical protein
MDTRITKLRKIAAFILTAALIILSIMALSSRVSLAAGNENEEDGDRPEITVEVVEDIPAAEIEEQEVPLADTPMTAAANNTRSTVISWTLGAVIIAYLVFLISGMRLRKNHRIKQAEAGGDHSGTGKR